MCYLKYLLGHICCINYDYVQITIKIYKNVELYKLANNKFAHVFRMIFQHNVTIYNLLLKSKNIALCKIATRTFSHSLRIPRPYRLPGASTIFEISGNLI